MSTSPPLVIADRYRLVAPLGQGGMGRVWRATDVVLHRDVAIKELVPPPGLTFEERQEMRERSLREARAIARLNNVNVVRIFDVLRTDADPWIVMEYVPSRSLQDMLATDGPFPPVRAAEIGLGMLNALRAAHRNGVVHRDVKPGNVLIGEDGRVVLTDFGLATVPGDPNVTRTGLVLGSPAYIAPERARDGTAGPAADLWSLGATLYAAVEGASPFARPSALATLSALATEPTPPARSAGPLKPVLNGLLRKDPAHRISAEEAERLLLRAAGRRSRLGFPMSPTMRRPGAGRERPTPAASGSPPVVPGPRQTATPSRPTPAEGRAPVFAPGKASVGPPARPADTRVDTPPVQDRGRPDQDLYGTGSDAPNPTTDQINEATENRAPGPGTADAPAGGALAKGTRGAYGTITPGGHAAAERDTAMKAAAERVAAREVAQREAAEREAAEREAAERAAAERKAAREAAERAAAEREAAEKAAAEREAVEREAVQREAAQKAAAELEAAEREVAEREAAEREAAEREAAEREAAEREAAENAAAENAAAENAAAEREAAEPRAAQRAKAEREEAEGEAAGTVASADTVPADDAGTAGTRATATNKPAVGARAGAHSTSRATRKKGRSRNVGATGAATSAAEAPAGATPVVDAGAAHDGEAPSHDHDSVAGGVETGGVETEEARTAPDAAGPGAPDLSVVAGPAAEEGAAERSKAEEGDAEPSEAEDGGAERSKADESPAKPSKSARTGTAEGGTSEPRAPKVAAARTGERKVTTATLPAATAAGAGTATGGKASAAGAAVIDVPLAGSGVTAESTQSRAAGATEASQGRTAGPASPTQGAQGRSTAAAGTKLHGGPTGSSESATSGTGGTSGPDASGTSGTGAGGTLAGAPGFQGSSRPAWQPMPVKPRSGDTGLTVFGVTLTRRQTAIGGAVLLVLVLALIFVLPRVVGGDDKAADSGRRTGGAPAATTPTTTAPTGVQPAPSTPAASTQPSPAPANANGGGGGVKLPAGWYLYKDQTGFSIPVPQGWDIRRVGTEVYFQERGGQYRLMIVDQTDTPQLDPVKDWQTKEADRIASYRDYHRIAIRPVSYWDKAADWEYTRTSDSGNPLHVVKRGFITAKDQAYGITWSTSAGDWEANRSNLNLIYKGFIPAKS